MHRSTTLYVLVGATAALLGRHADAELEIVRSTVDGGGVMRSADGGLELSGTVGQADAGVLTAGTLQLTGGFWFETPPTDCDDDGRVTLYDYQAFQPCLAGPAVGVSSPACACFDVNRDGVIDLHDVAIGQQSATGQ